MSKNSSNHNGSEAFEQILGEAAEWCIIFESETTNDNTQFAFNQWLKSSREHSRAWEEISKTWDTLNSAQRPEVHAALERNHIEEKQQRRRWLTTTLTCMTLFFALPISWLAWQDTSLMYWLADYRTVTGRRQTIDLDDGSRLYLNTDTAVDLDFTSKQRNIVLQQGEIYIDVAPNSKRPLIITTDVGSATALGTQFTVRRLQATDKKPTSMRVSVNESIVRVCPATIKTCREISQGQQVNIKNGQLSHTQTMTDLAQPAWLNDQINVLDQPVTDVLEELVRYHNGIILYDTKELMGIRVSGTLPLDNIPQALAALSATLPLEIKRYTNWLLIVSKSEKSTLQ